MVLKKWGKSQHNHGVQFTAQYALIKSLFHCISVTNYHRSDAAPFGTSRHKELKYYRTKKMQWKASIIPSLVFGEWPVGRCCTTYDRSYATFDSTLICCCALVCHMTHFSTGIQPPARRHSIQPIYASETVLGRYLPSVVCFRNPPTHLQ